MVELWTRKYFPKETKCSQLSKPSTDYHPVGLHDVMGAFLILCIGLTAALFTFGVEYFYRLVTCKTIGNRSKKQETDERQSIPQPTDRTYFTSII